MVHGMVSISVNYIQAITQISTLYLGVYSGVTVPLDSYSSVELALGGI